MSISDGLHKAVLELAEVLKKFDCIRQEKPVELNYSLKLVKESLDKEQRKKDIARELLSPVIKFLDETGDIIMSPTMKFRDCVSIDPNRAHITIKLGGSYSIEIWGLYNVESESGQLYFNDVPRSSAEIIERIINWLVKNGAKLPRVVEHEP